jgi:hypothetical protein
MMPMMPNPRTKIERATHEEVYQQDDPEFQPKSRVRRSKGFSRILGDPYDSAPESNLRQLLKEEELERT